MGKVEVYEQYTIGKCTAGKRGLYRRKRTVETTPRFTADAVQLADERQNSFCAAGWTANPVPLAERGNRFAAEAERRFNVKPNALIPVVAQIAPPLFLIALVGIAAKEIFFRDDKTLADGLNPIKAAAGNSRPLPSHIVPEKYKIPVKRIYIQRKHLKAIFQDGKMQFSRKAAAEHLQRLGFGKSAAYEALSPSGRFATWLRFAPDGVISWHNQIP